MEFKQQTPTKDWIGQDVKVTWIDDRTNKPEFQVGKVAWVNEQEKRFAIAQAGKENSDFDWQFKCHVEFLTPIQKEINQNVQAIKDSVSTSQTCYACKTLFTQDDSIVTLGERTFHNRCVGPYFKDPTVSIDVTHMKQPTWKPYVQPAKVDLINKAPHYNQSDLQPWDAVLKWNLNFCLGNVIKYIVRADHKGTPLQDLEKAEAYLKREIAIRKGEIK